jgi:hypothetical protein
LVLVPSLAFLLVPAFLLALDLALVFELRV